MTNPETPSRARARPCANIYKREGIAEPMQTYVVEKTDDSVTLGFKDANLTLITPLMKELYDDAQVDLVRYIEKHPELEDRMLFVKVKAGDPVEAVKRASDRVSEYYTIGN